MRFRARLRPAVVPVLALVTAFLLGAILILLTDFEHLALLGTDPGAALGGTFGGLVEAYGAMVAGAIGDPGRIVAAFQSGDPDDIAGAIRPIVEATVSATPLIFAGLGVAIAFHAGLFNLGALGQFVMGGLGATVTVFVLNGHLPPGLLLVGGLIGGTLFGAAYGFVPGYLKARTGAHEVITTLMLTPIVGEIGSIILGVVGVTGNPAAIVSVPRVLDLPSIRLDWGFGVALLAALVVSWLLFRTTIGFQLRATGFSASAARGAGMRPGMVVTLAMTLSGGFVGLGGAFLTLGPVASLAWPSPDFGFVALAIALIAGLRPSGVVLAALLYGALTNGAKQMVVLTDLPLALLTVIIACAMLLVAAPNLVRSMWRVRETGPTDLDRAEEVRGAAP